MKRPLLATPLALGFLALAPSAAHASEGPTRMWVFFSDHGRSPAQLELELKAREAELGPRTLARRAKVRADQLVDAYDLPPAPGYIAAVARTGADLRVESRWFNAVSIDADAATQAQIAALPFVRGLYPVGRNHDHGAEFELSPGGQAADPDDYGVGWEQLDLIGVPELHDCGLSGAGVLMGVQDLGFWLDHQAYATTQVIATRDFVDDDENVGPEPGDHPEQHIHGTVVLATITGDDPGNFRGAAPGVDVLLSKSEHIDIEEPFEEDIYVEGLEWIEAMGADIFTASLGYTDWYTIDDLDGASAVTTLAVEAAIANGVIVFTPMGNNGPDPSTLGAPADAQGAISLGAVDVEGQLAGFSSRGPTADDRIKPDVLAPGWNVFTVDPNTTDAYAPTSGTSLSTPIAAGVGALLLEAYPWLTPAEMAELLRSTASQAQAPDNDRGYGIINAVAAAELYCTCSDEDGDHFFDVACGGSDCADQDPGVNPEAEELCNGIDDDCDEQLGPGEEDADDDGYFACADDCDDTRTDVHPGADEICDNDIDDDCNMLTDELDPACMPAGDGDGDGAGASGDESGGDTGAEGTGAEDSETGAPLDPGGADEGQGGCACQAEPARGLGGSSLALLACLGLGLGFRRRTTSPPRTTD